MKAGSECVYGGERVSQGLIMKDFSAMNLRTKDSPGRNLEKRELCTMLLISFADPGCSCT